MIKRLLRKLCITLVVLALVALGIIAHIGSKATLSPPRRSMEKWHREILADTPSHGIAVSHHTSNNGTPYMLCETGSVETGKKSLALRNALRQRKVKLEPWGDMRGTILLLHGHKGCKEDHLPIAERFCAAGFRCVCLDLPGHGQHPAPYATFGYTEVALIQEVWREYLITNPRAETPLFLFGVSQGAAIALQAAAHPAWSIRGVASVCAFTSLTQPIDTSADHLPLVIRDLKPLTTRACALGIYCRAGFFPQQISPLQAASHLQCPVFLCHGSKDGFIPVQSARDLYQAVPHEQKTLRIIEDASHHNVLSTGSTELYADICEFFINSL
jgi:pimeloyl-ACP methyl ester carboxylesterase